MSVTIERAKSLARVRYLLASGQAKAIRVAAGLSRGEVAEAVGVDPATVWRWEAGERIPRGDIALAYGALLEGLQR